MNILDIGVDIIEIYRIKELLDKIDSKDADAIFMNKTYYDIALEEYPDIAKSLKLIYTVDVVDTVQTMKSDKDITKEPFTVYISGIDTSGNVASGNRYLCGASATLSLCDFSKWNGGNPLRRNQAGD